MGERMRKNLSLWLGLTFLVLSAITITFTYLRTPIHAYRAAAWSCQVRDWEAFSKWVDVGSVVGSAVKEMSIDAGANPRVAEMLADSLRDSLVLRLREAVKSEGGSPLAGIFNKGVLNRDLMEVSSNDPHTFIKFQRPTSYLGFEAPVTLDFKQGFWRCTLVGVSVGAWERADSVTKALVWDYYRLAQRDSIDSMVSIKVTHKRMGCGGRVFEGCLQDLACYTVSVTNRCDRFLDSVVYEVRPAGGEAADTACLMGLFPGKVKVASDRCVAVDAERPEDTWWISAKAKTMRCRVLRIVLRPGWSVSDDTSQYAEAYTTYKPTVVEVMERRARHGIVDSAVVFRTLMAR